MKSDRYALLSVSDKSGLAEFARALSETHGFQILSTGGTRRYLADSAIPVVAVESLTGHPEILDGRVKSLHPKIHGGLLFRADRPSHIEETEKYGIPEIDIVVVNLYPFESVVAQPSFSLQDAIENIDIGGPALLRSAAKNHERVAVICDPVDYRPFLQALEGGDEEELRGLRRTLAYKAFARTAAYDKAISRFLQVDGEEPGTGAGDEFPPVYHLALKRAFVPRYGENPHQGAALYGEFFDHFTQLQGQTLSYINLLDITAASNLIEEFDRPTVAILKHGTPCGVASSETLEEAWEAALATDRQSPFGGIVVVNRCLGDGLGGRLGQIFCHIIIAPEFAPSAREKLSRKKNLRLMVADRRDRAPREIRSVVGGIVVQDRDLRRAETEAWKVVTERSPEPNEWDSMQFAWRVAKHVKSNAIVYASGERTIGIGAGQMSRVDASRIAVWKAGEAGLNLRGTAVASEAYFPFADGLEEAAEAGATAAVQPGGSVRDAEVIDAANRCGLTMAFTGVRHFRH